MKGVSSYERVLEATIGNNKVFGRELAVMKGVRNCKMC